MISSISSLMTRTRAAERTRLVQVEHYAEVLRRARAIEQQHGQTLNDEGLRLVRHAGFAAWLALRELGAVPW